MITPTKEAYINSICIKKGSVQYELAFLDDFTPKQEWFDETHLDRILFNMGTGIPKSE